jgi:hypothetical protein
LERRKLLRDVENAGGESILDKAILDKAIILRQAIKIARGCGYNRRKTRS